MRIAWWLVFSAVLLSFVSVPISDAWAAPSARQRKAARRLADTGLKAFKSKDYQKAVDAFERAEAIIHAPPHVLYIARSYKHLGQLLKARESYRAVVGDKLNPRAPKAFRKAQSAAGKELGELEKAIPRIVIEIEGPPIASTIVTINGENLEDVMKDVDPGDYEINATSESYAPATKTVSLEAGSGTTTVKLTLEPTIPIDEEEPEEEVDLPLPPIIIAAGGAAALIAGGIVGGLALRKAGQLKDACPTNPCATKNEKLKDKANTLATVSTTLLVVGGVAFAAGGSWLVYALMEDEDASLDAEPTEQAWRVRPLIGPGFVGVDGAF